MSIDVRHLELPLSQEDAVQIVNGFEKQKKWIHAQLRKTGG